MKQWIRSFVPSIHKPDPSGSAPRRNPYDQPAGIDRLIAGSRSDKAVSEADERGFYSTLFPVRRLTIAMEAPMLPPDRGANETTSPPDDTPPQPNHGTAAEPAPDVPLAQTAAADDLSSKGEPSPSVSPTTEIKIPPVRWDTLHAMVQQAKQQGELEVAIDWCGLMRLAFPGVFHGYTDGAMALAELGRFDEARALLNEAAIRIIGEPGIPVTYAQLEALAGDMNASVEHWRAALRLPLSPWWVCAGLVDALERQHKGDEADDILAYAVREKRFHHPALLTKAISYALNRQEWSVLAERLIILGNTASESEILLIDLYENSKFLAR